jgi:hypothetical protein
MAGLGEEGWTQVPGRLRSGEETRLRMGQLLLLYTRSVLRWLYGFSTRRQFLNYILFFASARGGGG